MLHFLQQQTLTHKTLSMTRRILLPIDSTGEDVEVLKWVLGNVHRAGDQIVLLHVCVVLYFLVSRSLPLFLLGRDDDENFLPLSFLSHLFLHHSSPHAQKTHRIPARFPQYAWGMYDDSFVEVPDPEEEKKWREDCAKYVAETLLPILDQRGNVTYKLDIIAYEMNNTSIGEIVCEKAKIIDVDLVVMASHRKGRLQEFFVGSVTNYCLHHSKVPLLVYKGPKETDINTKYYTGDISKKEKETSSSQHKEGKTPSIDFEKATLQEG